MKILHTVASLGIKSGGPSQSIYRLVSALNALNCHTDVLTLEPRSSNDFNVGSDCFIHTVDNDAISPLHISRNFRCFLKTKNEYMLYHANGLWLDQTHATATTALSKRIPYFLTLRGMLYPQALMRSPWRKRLMLALGHRKDIAGANCIHATCTQEMIYYRQLGFTNPVVVIPNPVEIPSFVDTVHRRDERFRIGFLGRIHSRKHVHDLISAWANLGSKVADGEFIIIGDGDPVYLRLLKEQVLRLGLKNVRFTGFVFGREKFELLATLSALFVPSDFENFGMIIAEALSVGTPVMASLGTPWEELNTHNCGWWCENDIMTLTSSMENVLSLSLRERIEMGQRGIKLVTQKYSSYKVAFMMKKAYKYILHGGLQPEFVFI